MLSTYSDLASLDPWQYHILAKVGSTIQKNILEILRKRGIQQSSKFPSFVIETLLYITIHLLALLRNNASKKETRHQVWLLPGSSKALKVVLARLDGETLAIQSSRLELFKQVSTMYQEKNQNQQNPH